VLEVLDGAGVDQSTVVGYSMGGRLALYLALRHPDRCAGLFLESASPGLEDAGERAARRRADEEKARG
jgi:pimeloyl-ACP methyl ester carboxylesterase